MSLLSSDHDGLSPSFDLKINGQLLDDEIMRAVISVEYDSSDNAVDMMKLSVYNHNSEISSRQIFNIGDTIALFGGHVKKGGDLLHIGSAIIEKIRPSWGGNPDTLSIVAYTPDRKMARNAPNTSSEERPFLSEEEEKKEKKKKKRDSKGRVYGDENNSAMFSEAVRSIASHYNFTPFIDDTPDHAPIHGFIHKVGMSDLDFVVGLANESNHLFFVRGAPDGSPKFELYFLHPDTLDLQEEEFTFHYSNGNESSLIEFDGNQELGNGISKLQGQFKHPKTGKMISFSIDGEKEVETDTYTGDMGIATNKPQPIDEVLFTVGGSSVKVVVGRNFGSVAQLKLWAQAWYKQNNERFFTGRGTVQGPGTETLSARQRHNLSGLGDPWDGRYYFTTVTHVFKPDGYQVEFTAQKEF